MMTIFFIKKTFWKFQLSTFSYILMTYLNDVVTWPHLIAMESER